MKKYKNYVIVFLLLITALFAYYTVKAILFNAETINLLKGSI